MVMKYKRRKWVLSLVNFSHAPVCVRVCVCTWYEMTDTSDCNPCPRNLWTPVFPRKILPDPPAQCRPDLLGPKGSLYSSFAPCSPSFPSLALSNLHSLTHTDNHHPEGPQRERERNGSCHFSLLTQALSGLCHRAPEGRTSNKGKTFHTLLSFTTEGSYLFSHSLTLSSLSFFTLLSYSSHSSSLPFSSASAHFPLYLYFIRFDGLTVPFDCASLSEIQRGQRGENGRG